MPKQFIFVRALAAFVLCTSISRAQIKVTQNGSMPVEKQDGASWETALSGAKLAERMSGPAKGGSGGEYWLAMGVYPFLRPHQGVQIYGGFAGHEKQRHERSPSTNQTTIMGISFAQYEVWDQDNRLVARKHPGEGTLIDGCTLFPTEAGSALSGNYSSQAPLEGPPLVQNCKIVGSVGFSSVVNVGHGPLKIVNSEIRGGLGAGLTVGGSDGFVELINCFIHLNGEAGLISWNHGSLKAIGCTISANGRDASSGLPPVSRYSGIYVQGASAEIVGCVITENQGELGSGITAIITENNTHKVRVVDSIISSNTTVRAGRLGGGIHSWTLAAVTPDRVIVSNCVINANTNLASTGAGGAYLYASGTRLEDCKITANQTAENGGGIFAHSPSLEPAAAITVIRNSLIAENSAVNGGGVCLQFSNARIINCTIANNHATGQGGAIFSDGERRIANTPFLPLRGRAFIANTGIIGNTAAQGTLLYHVAAFSDPADEPPPPTFMNSAYSDGATAMRRRNGVNEALPIPAGLTAVPAAQFIRKGDYRLAPGSALIDAGANVVAAGLDLDLSNRIVGPSVDIGAYEATVLGEPKQLSAAVVYRGQIRIRFSGGLQFTPSISSPDWRDVPGAGEVDLTPQGQHGFLRAVLP